MTVNVMYEDGQPYVKGTYQGKTYTLTEEGRFSFAVVASLLGWEYKEQIFQATCEAHFDPSLDEALIEEVIVEDI